MFVLLFFFFLCVCVLCFVLFLLYERTNLQVSNTPAVSGLPIQRQETGSLAHHLWSEIQSLGEGKKQIKIYSVDSQTLIKVSRVGRGMGLRNICSHSTNLKIHEQKKQQPTGHGEEKSGKM